MSLSSQQYNYQVVSEGNHESSNIRVCWFVGQHLAEHLSNQGDEVFCSDLSLGGPDLLDAAGINDLVSRINLTMFTTLLTGRCESLLGRSINNFSR